MFFQSCVLPSSETVVSISKKGNSTTNLSLQSFTSSTLNFNSSTGYVLSNSRVGVDNADTNVASLLALDLLDHLTTGASGDLGFESGGLSGTIGVTYNANNKVVLNTVSNLNNNEHERTWSPKNEFRLGYWNLNGTVGALANGSTLTGIVGPNLTAVGTGLSHATGKLNQGVTGFTTTSFLDAGVQASLSNLANVSLGGWIYTTSNSTDQVIGGQLHGYMLALTSAGKILFLAGNGTTWDCYVESRSIFSPNIWQHVLGTYNGSVVRLYIGGLLEGECNKTGTTGANATNKFTLGAAHTPGDIYQQPFQGILDDFFVLSNDLSATEAVNISNKQNFIHTGNYYSRIMDSGAVTNSWNRLGFKMPFPFGKAMSATADNLTDYTGMTSNFSTNLVAL